MLALLAIAAAAQTPLPTCRKPDPNGPGKPGICCWGIKSCLCVFRCLPALLRRRHLLRRSACPVCSAAALPPLLSL